MTIIYDLGRKENVAPDSVSVTRKLRVVPYADHINIMAQLIGGVRLIGGYLVRIPPARDPFLPWCFCTKIDVENMPDDVYGTGQPGTDVFSVVGQKNTYEQGALLSCTFNTLSWDQPDKQEQPSNQQEIDFADEEMDFNIQNLTLPDDYYAFNGEGQADPALLRKEGRQAIKSIPRIDYTLIRHYCVNIPYQAITKLCGRINARDITRRGKIILPTETARFEGASVKRKVTNQGLKFAEVTYKFAFQSIFDTIETGKEAYVGWNRIFRPKKSRWERVFTVGDRKPVYNTDASITQPIGGATVVGFDLLFNAGAG